MYNITLNDRIKDTKKFITKNTHIKENIDKKMQAPNKTSNLSVSNKPCYIMLIIFTQPIYRSFIKTVKILS